MSCGWDVNENDVNQGAVQGKAIEVISLVEEMTRVRGNEVVDLPKLSA